MRFPAFLMLAGLVLSGCSGHELRPDALPASMESNYPSLEMYACGKHFHGLGECALELGQDTNTVQLKIQTYYNGTLLVDSPDCDYHQIPIAYTGSQQVPINISGALDRDCTFGITLSPEYPNQQNQSIRVKSFRGYLRIRSLSPGTHWSGFGSRVREGEFSQISLPASGPKRTVIKGCGLDIDKTLEPVDGQITLSLRDLGFDPRVKRCGIEGILVGDQPQDDLLFTWVVTVFSKSFVPLAVPALTFQGKKLSVFADDNVSVVALGNEYRVDREGKFNFDPTIPTTLRAITVGGRSAIADWDPAKNSWVWVSNDE